MTDPQTSAPQTSAPQTSSPMPGPAASRGVKIALALSVALNLAVAGLAVGAWLRDGHRGMPRDMTFGPFSEALDDVDRKAIRKALMERVGEFRSQRAAAQAEFETLVATLRADPFDPAAMQAALSAIEARNSQRLELGRSLIETRLTEMSPEARKAFADRLEAGMRRGGRD